MTGDVEDDPDPMRRRDYLMIRAMSRGADWPMVLEAIATTAIAHPDWDLDELKTFEEWRLADLAGEPS